MTFEVNFINRNGDVSSSRHFSETGANDYFVLTGGNGRFVGGQIVTNGEVVRESGVLKGTTIKKARAALRAG